MDAPNESYKSLAFHFDVMCPWAFQTSLWMREVRDRLGIDVDWCFFSLEEINRNEGKKHPWEREWSYGWSMMRIGALLKRIDPALNDAWYFKSGTALHMEGRKPHDPDVARSLLKEMDQDPSLVLEALEDGSTHDDVRNDHEKVVSLGGFGVPTLVFENDERIFGPVLINPPKGEKAEKLWHLIVGWLDFPNVYEVQRPKMPADLELIAETFNPYVKARDWETRANPTP